MKHIFQLFISAVLLSAIACQPTTHKQMNTDTHTYAQPESGVITHLDLIINVDFDKSILDGTATYNIKNHTNTIVLDCYGLDIEEVFADGTPTKFALSKHNEIKGQALTIDVKESTKTVAVKYKTTDNAKALQWLTPEQTGDKTHPFLFTQSQAILARTWIPVQDSPGIRFTYNAKVKVPTGLMATMSAENDNMLSETGEYEFSMTQPIPAYLMALAVGNYTYKSISDRAGVYAEPGMIDVVTEEFSQVEDMIVAAENLYGPYAWEQYDIIVLPPSFPFGGMENPRLTFATPTIIAGDKSLVSLIAHELAHSWSGNLVTNKTWDDFWLNEGFTVYFERRIMEAIEGKAYASMLEQLGYQDLLGGLDYLKDTPKDTHLKLALQGRDPDDGMTDIAYEKGYFFIRMLEEFVGREKLDAFLKNYFTTNAFKVMDTEMFLNILYSYFPDVEKQKEQLKIHEWVYGAGLPINCPEVSSVRFEKVNEVVSKIEQGVNPSEIVDETTNWSSHEWLYFLRELEEGATLELVKELDKTFNFTQSGNNEVLAAWFQLTIPTKYQTADEIIESFLVKVGRRKFLTPTYEALIKADTTKEKARAIYAKARPNYHSVATQTIDALLN